MVAFTARRLGFSVVNGLKRGKPRHAFGVKDTLAKRRAVCLRRVLAKDCLNVGRAFRNVEKPFAGKKA